MVVPTDRSLTQVAQRWLQADEDLTSCNDMTDNEFKASMGMEEIIYLAENHRNSPKPHVLPQLPGFESSGLGPGRLEFLKENILAHATVDKHKTTETLTPQLL